MTHVATLEGLGCCKTLPRGPSTYAFQPPRSVIVFRRKEQWSAHVQIRPKWKRVRRGTLRDWYGIGTRMRTLIFVPLANKTGCGRAVRSRAFTLRSGLFQCTLSPVWKLHVYGYMERTGDGTIEDTPARHQQSAAVCRPHVFFDIQEASAPYQISICFSLDNIGTK